VGLTNDVLVVQQNPFYTINANDSFSGHIVTAADYQVVSDQLKADTNTTQDLNSIGYMKNRNFSISLRRGLSSHNGEDWNAALYRYSMTQICFYTSDTSFSASNWKGTYSVCNYFEISNFYSTFRGLYLKDIKLNGYAVSVYGYIGGPYVTINAFFYHTTPLYTYNVNPAIVLELGAATNSNYQDFNVYSTTSSENGDYFGSDIQNIRRDI
jgi:peroxiredoxin